MKLLLIAATEGEVAPLLQYLQQDWNISSSAQFRKGAKELQICITGVGMVATTYAVTKAIQQNKYDLALQVGVGGSFDKNYALGDILFVNNDQYGDLGAEDKETYLDIFEMGLLHPDASPFSGNQLKTPLLPMHQKIDLPKVNGLTVNTVSGNEITIQKRMKKYSAQIESMEGAAFHYVCLNEGVPFAQIRSISNYVEPRDKSKWKMKEAIISLNKWLIDFLENI